MNAAIQDSVVNALRDGGWITFFIIFWGGAALSLSSCTLIRVPVIISYVGAASTSRKRAFLLTLSFALALIFSYTLLGLLFGFLSGIMAGMIRWSRYFYYAIGALALLVG